MCTLRILFIVLTSFFIFSSINNKVDAQELVTNGGFETGDLTGWTLIDHAYGGFFVYSGTMSPIQGMTILAPPVGIFAAVTDSSGRGATIIFQDIALPPAENVICTAIVYVENRASSYFDNGTLKAKGGGNQQMRVDIMDPNFPPDDVGAGVLANLFITLPGDPLSIGYTNLTADLSPFAGQTVRIRIAEVDNQFFFNGSVDAVSCTIAPPSGPIVIIPTMGQWGMIMATILIGFFAIRMLRNRKDSEN